jgi:hypothetical protein
MNRFYAPVAGGQLDVPQTVGAMDPGRVARQLDQRTSSAQGDRYLRCVDEIEDAQRVRGSVLHARVSRDTRDPVDVDVRVSHREHESESIVPPGINVEEDLVTHRVRRPLLVVRSLESRPLERFAASRSLSGRVE